MNKAISKITPILLAALSQAALPCLSWGASGRCTRIALARDGEIIVTFTLPKELVAPPWNLDALAEHGFSLEKHGCLPYFPVRPLALEVSSKTVSVELLEAKLAEAPDILRHATRRGPRRCLLSAAGFSVRWPKLHFIRIITVGPRGYRPNFSP